MPVSFSVDEVYEEHWGTKQAVLATATDEAAYFISLLLQNILEKIILGI